ncbi:MAG TPA: glutathione S-transferase family protein [Candidatus Krumholzibacterium sp.]|nr:glutathione S-transferase family protein [Candidatus Krumholzibacterium sp.]
MIDLRLSEGGPYHLGERFSLVDLTLAYWTVCLEYADALESFPAVRRCFELVTGRPKLHARFADIRAWAQDYEALRARGKGVA